GGEAAPPRDVEEVVGGRAGGEVPRETPRQGGEDEGGVEVARVVRDDHERAAERLDLGAAEHLHPRHAAEHPGEHDALRDVASRSHRLEVYRSSRTSRVSERASNPVWSRVVTTGGYRSFGPRAPGKRLGS